MVERQEGNSDISTAHPRRTGPGFVLHLPRGKLKLEADRRANKFQYTPTVVCAAIPRHGFTLLMLSQFYRLFTPMVESRSNVAEK
jgi:hypothetical protein